MKLLDLTLPSPAENLACDEALLDACEAGTGEEALRFWESPEYFVVVGYANRAVTEVNLAVCETKEIPVYRRCSGGGTVLQGPGCLNYTLILKITEAGPLHGITSANRFIMDRNRAAIESILSSVRLTTLAPSDGERDGVRGPRLPVMIRGHTDLCLGNLKFSGNSQRRRKHSLLFHGTFLLNFDLALVGEVLRTPSKQPDYRANRAHSEFLMNLGLPAEKVKAALKKTWNAGSPLENLPLEKTVALAKEKYSLREWNFKF